MLPVADEMMRRELAQVRAIAEKALRVSEKNDNDHLRHEQICEERYNNIANEIQSLREGTKDLRDDLKTVRPGINDDMRIFRETFQTSMNENAERIDKLNDRIGNTAKLVVDSANTTIAREVGAVKDVLTNSIASTSNALAAFMNAQTETNRGINTRMDGVDINVTAVREGTNTRISDISRAVTSVRDQQFYAVLSIALMSMGGLLWMIAHYSLHLW